uniref:hypothetical protein n=1 Tax=Nocardia farcinica TaxID=37329 RepID=UPI002457E597
MTTPEEKAAAARRAAEDAARVAAPAAAADREQAHARADRIAAALRAGRERAGHPLTSAQDLVTAVTPAVFLHRDVRR